MLSSLLLNSGDGKQVCRALQRPEEGVRTLGDGVIGSYEPPYIGASN